MLKTIDSRYLLIKIDKEVNKIVNIYDILMMEKISNNEVLIVCKKNEFIIRATLNEIMNLIQSNLFFRCHRSYIININYIDKICDFRNYSEINFLYTSKKALISKQKKKEFITLNTIKQLKKI